MRKSTKGQKGEKRKMTWLRNISTNIVCRDESFAEINRKLVKYGNILELYIELPSGSVRGRYLFDEIVSFEELSK